MVRASIRLEWIFTRTWFLRLFAAARKPSFSTWMPRNTQATIPLQSLSMRCGKDRIVCKGDTTHEPTQDIGSKSDLPFQSLAARHDFHHEVRRHLGTAGNCGEPHGLGASR